MNKLMIISAVIFFVCFLMDCSCKTPDNDVFYVNIQVDAELGITQENSLPV